MTLLLDHHLSRKLVTRLADLFPQASHVALHGLDAADDLVIWTFARTHGYTIVTKDSDFNDVSTLRGAPPQIIWLRIGNSTTSRASGSSAVITRRSRRFWPARATRSSRSSTTRHSQTNVGLSDYHRTTWS